MYICIIHLYFRYYILSECCFSRIINQANKIDYMERYFRISLSAFSAKSHTFQLMNSKFMHYALFIVCHAIEPVYIYLYNYALYTPMTSSLSPL